MLAITIVGALAAIAAAMFTYPSWKASLAKPELRLVVEAGPATSALFFMKLKNEGEGSGVDWIVEFKMKRGSRFIPNDLSFRGWTDRETSDEWVATWMASGSDDSIGPGLHRSLLMTPASGSPVSIHATYSINAGRMKERTGRIEVGIGDDPERLQTITTT